MKKIKVISSNFPTTFEYEINHFLSNFNVIGIQYGFSADSRNPLFTAMIIYEEE